MRFFSTKPTIKKNPIQHYGPMLLVLAIALLFFVYPALIRAQGPTGGEEIGLASQPLQCLVVGPGSTAQAKGTVNLTWEGKATQARLIMSISGSQAPHTIKLNGQPVAAAPILPEGQTCQEGTSVFLDIPPQVLQQGQNTIELTADALPSDSWSAATIRLEAIGLLHQSPQPANQILLGAGSTIYPGQPEQFRLWIPDGYTSASPTPLLVALHPRSNTMFWGEETYASGSAPVPIDHKGWIMVSPEMHGSWPDSEPPLPSPGAYNYISLEAQADIMAAVNYALANYNIDTSRIYLTGYSMGGQGAVVMAAKHPHLFAAMFDNKGPTDMYDWYDDNSAFHQNWMERECHIGGDPKEPAQNPFCYQRRSGLSYAGNLLHTPISITHGIPDVLVPITQSYRLRDKVNALGPDYPLAVYGEPNPVDENNDPCPPDWHCYDPPPMNVLNFLEPFSLNNTPDHINITTDQSKAFYWLAISQTGGDHWSQVEVWVDEEQETVTAHISDTASLDLGFNLGTDPITETLSQPGMGFGATTYLVKEQGQNPYLAPYISGYFTPTLNSTGQYSLTIAAVDLQLAANPSVITGDQGGTATITATVQDRLGNFVPNGTSVTLTTTAGAFSNGLTTIVRPTVNGLATTSLNLGPGDSSAQIEATVMTLNATTIVEVIDPGIAVSISANPAEIFNGETVTFSYQISNTGDVTLTNVVLSDDYGVVSACNNVSLVPGQLTSCGTRDVSPNQTVTNLATVNGTLTTGGVLSDTDSVMVTVYDLTVAADPAQVATFGGQPVTATITAQAKDQFNTFPATGTPVQFTTSQGTLPGGGQTYNTTLNNGQASLVLTLAGSDDLAQVAALVSSIAETTTVDVVHPSMIVTASTDAAYITAGGLVTFSYQVENTGDIALSSVTVTDNFGSVSGCTGMLLAIGQVKACGPRSVTVNQTTANAVMVVGTALSANDTIASDTVTATVVTIDVEASPDAIMADGLSTATITATIQDEGALPLPDGTPVQFSTDLGTLANGGAATISGGQGQAVVTLTASSTAGLATVNAKLGQAIGSAYVTMINPFASLDITVTPGQTSVQSGGTVTYTYNLTNIGSVTLTSVSVVDDNGTPGNTSDDVVINCGSPTLPSGEARNCAPRSVAITQSVTNIVTAVGTDVTPGDITASDTTTVLVQNSVTYLPIVIRP